ncbi:MAG: hypothetical protein M3N47_06160 [Chloroflexota bacterium]|nr:hypothetical protein [Chloroflexota bacterium]
MTGLLAAPELWSPPAPPRRLNQPAPTSPNQDAVAANMQLERLAACWAAGHRNNRKSNGSTIL